MTTLGYKLSSEERSAPQLVEDAVQAEEAGFAFLAISDHYHPVSSCPEGEFFRVETARLCSIPEEPPPIYVAASGPVHRADRREARRRAHRCRAGSGGRLRLPWRRR